MEIFGIFLPWPIITLLIGFVVVWGLIILRQSRCEHSWRSFSGKYFWRKGSPFFLRKICSKCWKTGRVSGVF